MKLIKIFFCFFPAVFLSVMPSFGQIGAASVYKDSTDIKVTIAGANALYNGTIIGQFKKTLIDKDLTLIVIYNTQHARVAEATYAQGDADWTIITPVDQHKMQLPYSKAHPLEDLFKCLIGKNYL